MRRLPVSRQIMTPRKRCIALLTRIILGVCVRYSVGEEVGTTGKETGSEWREGSSDGFRSVKTVLLGVWAEYGGLRRNEICDTLRRLTLSSLGKINPGGQRVQEGWWGEVEQKSVDVVVREHTVKGKDGVVKQGCVKCDLASDADASLDGDDEGMTMVVVGCIDDDEKGLFM
ncbi:hypothetical protein BC829DRAFT_432213 [Chytridium lagenaria]|nr:hypothetical protein BC829DRAFT_432213 [Chytridium lagenaria]